MAARAKAEAGTAILIGIGANLPSPRHGAPEATCVAALDALDRVGVRVVRRSRWYRTEPVPASDQPAYVNGVAAVATGLDPDSLLAALHRIEDRFGRRRRKPNEPRIIDLDLLAHGSVVREAAADRLVLPHPRLHERAFVLRPLVEIAAAWRHPILGLTARDLLDRLPPGQVAEPIGAGRQTPPNREQP